MKKLFFALLLNVSFSVNAEDCLVFGVAESYKENCKAVETLFHEYETKSEKADLLLPLNLNCIMLRGQELEIFHKFIEYYGDSDKFRQKILLGQKLISTVDIRLLKFSK